MAGTRNHVLVALLAIVLSAPLAGCESTDREQETDSSRAWLDRSSPSGFEVIDTATAVCDDCIVFEPVAVLGDEDGPGFYDGSAGVQIDSRGRYWVSSRDVVKVYAASGEYLEQVGRPGQGPGEFGRAGPILRGDGGLMHVFDGGNGRVSTFESEGTFVEAQGLPGLVRDVATHPDLDGILTNIILNSPEHVGAPIHLLGDAGIVRSYFSVESGSLRENMLRNVAVDRSGYIYGAKRWDYTVDVWAPTGERVFGIDRPGLWRRFPDGESRALVKGGEPAGFIEDVRVDARGRLWVMAYVPQPDWADHVTERELPNGLVVLEPTETAASIYDSVIEVVDLNQARVIARVRRDLPLRDFIGADLIYNDGLSARGEPVIEVWRITLRNP